MKSRPTGISAMAATVAIWILSEVGVDMPPEVAASAVGLIAALVSAFTPRG